VEGDFITAEPAEGQVIEGKYLLGSILGRGGMGIVFAAHHLQLEQDVAIKFLLPEFARQPEWMKRFLREAQAAFRIQTEHVVRILDFGVAAGTPFFVMERLLGEPLASYGRRMGPLAPGDAIDLLLQVCAALREAHANGIVHRDLKPANMFLVSRGDGTRLLKVLDFGISKHAAPGEQLEDVITRSSEILGSAHYMSPEQLRKTSAVGPRSDIWALGVVLYQLLTRRVPFESETTAGIVLAIVADPPPDLRTVRPDLPPALAAVVARCLEKDPSARYPSVVELADALRAALAPEALVSMGPQAAPNPGATRAPISAPVSEPLRAFIPEVSSVTAPLVVTEPSTAQSWSGSHRPPEPTPPKPRPLILIGLAGFAVIMLGATLALVLASRSSQVAGAPAASSAISPDAPSALVASAVPPPASAAPSSAPSSPSAAASSALAPAIARPPRRRPVSNADDLSRATQDRK
jgi:eukaryotic-like serine/threonine-protein kinase